MNNEFGLYLHFPFCVQKCHYCDFNSYSGLEELMLPYAGALIDEIKNSLPINNPVGSIYFGGGTPSYFPKDLLVFILDFIKESFLLPPDVEITAEANPGAADAETLIALRQAGCNRLSIGLQAAQDDLLRTIGRIHNWKEFRALYELAGEVGFANIGVDLIYGLPGQSVKNWMETLLKVTGLGPKHISAYSLQLEEGTPLKKLIEAGRLELPTEAETVEMMRGCAAFLTATGYEHYEISNYAKPGFRSRHNLYYWTNRDYLGFGAGAVSTWRGRRWRNLKSPAGYIERIKAGLSAVEETETISVRIGLEEKLILGLRLSDGIDLEWFQTRLAPEIYEALAREIQGLTERGFLKMSGGNLSLTESAIPVSNQILTRLLSTLGTAAGPD